MRSYVRPLAASLLRLPSHVKRLWAADFEDVRIILEQQGDLKYFAVSKGVQRVLARGAIVVSGSALVLMMGLFITAVLLHNDKSKLERSHQEVYSALLGSTYDMELDNIQNLDADHMPLLAQAIRERDLELRRFVDSAKHNLTEENVTLKSRLDSSGLTEKAIRVIQGAAAMGGGNPDDEERSDPLLRTGLAEESAKNRALKEVLLALPSTMPMRDFSTTSSFGIRKHPIFGSPRFHAGVDLTPRSDESVYAAKPGQVILARVHHNYGNTVIIRHDRGIETLYAHLANIQVREGQEVDTNTVLGRVGSTGSSTGVHLHFEVSVGGYPVDPQKVIETAHYVQQTQNQPR
jgi:murein DD-endopeptidase MepM/ murein hydrolase activator NlpD